MMRRERGRGLRFISCVATNPSKEPHGKGIGNPHLEGLVRKNFIVRRNPRFSQLTRGSSIKSPIGILNCRRERRESKDVSRVKHQIYCTQLDAVKINLKRRT